LNEAKEEWTDFAVENASELSGQEIDTLATNAQGVVWLGTAAGVMMRDEVKPYIEAGNPAHNGQQVNTSAKIYLTFSEPMKIEAVQSAFTLLNSHQIAVEGDFEWSDDARSLTFTPHHALEANQTYTVSMATSAVDLAGNSLSPGKYTVTFLTDSGGGSIEPTANRDVSMSGSGCFIDSSGNRSRFNRSRFLLNFQSRLLGRLLKFFYYICT
jgi:methionine-rich copper-binding protein CopC